MMNREPVIRCGKRFPRKQPVRKRSNRVLLFLKRRAKGPDTGEKLRVPQTDFQRIADNVYESAYEIKIRNHKETEISVDVVEPMPGDWSILNSSHTHVKKDAHTAIFAVPVAKDGETVVKYRARVKF